MIGHFAMPLPNRTGQEPEESEGARPETDALIEQLTADITREWAQNGEIVIFRVDNNGAPDALRSWAEVVLETAQKNPVKRSLHDFSKATPITLPEQLETLLGKQGQNLRRMAFILPPSISSQLIRNQIEGRSRRYHGVMLRFFLAEKEAMRWLRCETTRLSSERFQEN